MKRRSFSQSSKIAHYVMSMLPVLNEDALFSDESAGYVSPEEPSLGEQVTIRLRTARANVDEVYLLTGDTRRKMVPDRTEGVFDYYKIILSMPGRTLSYCFEIISGMSRVWLTKSGISEQPDNRHPFRVIPGFHVPEWAKGAVMYQIFTDRFCNGDPKNDVLEREYSYIGQPVHKVTDWDTLPASTDIRNFYGGDLEGVRQKLDYLQTLGIEAIYFNPLFVSPSNHKYDTQDYDYIDPHFGTFVTDEGQVLPDGSLENAKSSRFICRVTRMENLEASNALFAKLCEEIHARGMRIILDGVFNHCGSFNKWMDREKIYDKQPGYEPGAYISADSPYSSFFHFSDPGGWPDNASYEGWWNHDTLPKLNYEQSDLLAGYILRIARKWVSPPYNIDGWRLDVAADLGFSPEYNHKFWKLFRREVKAVNPDAVIIAEHYGDAQPWLGGDEWDTVMNYDAFMEPVTWFFTGMEKHSDEFLEAQIGNADSFCGSMRYHMGAFTQPSLLTAMNELSNHDHSRFLTRTSHKVGRARNFNYDAASDGINKAVMREAVVMQMTWPGAPAIYYGDEAGLCGFTDPDNRRAYPWGHEDRQMIEFHRAAIQMHKTHAALKTGSVRFLAGGKGYLSFARFDDSEKIIAVFNNSGADLNADIPVWTAEVPMNGELVRIFYTDERDFTREAKVFRVIQGELHLALPRTSAIVLCFRKSEKFAQKPRWW